jgi:3-deoxy-manno-octulosonate cytidylyltransferase (CMP-KDO synthetase)
MPERPVLAVVPARWASSRLPGKPLADIGGRPMVRRVWERASAAGFARVLVATDHEGIAGAVRGFGGEAVLTDAACPTGTDRCAAAADAVGWPEEGLVINVQGDEPFLDPSHLRLLAGAFADPAVAIATLAVPLTDPLELRSPHVPKVVVARSGNALYFSRQPIPHVRDADPRDWPARHPMRRHVGVYAFRRNALSAVTALPPSPLERAESLEQLRWLEHGHAIRVVDVEASGITVDTPEDLARANAAAPAEDARWAAR